MKLIIFVRIFVLAFISSSARSSQPELPGKEPSVTLPSLAIGVATGALLKTLFTIHSMLSDTSEYDNPLLERSEQINQDSHIVNGICILTAIGACYLSSPILRYFADRSRFRAERAYLKPSLDEPFDKNRETRSTHSYA